jgi:hypothetical protein
VIFPAHAYPGCRLRDRAPRQVPLPAQPIPPNKTMLGPLSRGPPAHGLDPRGKPGPIQPLLVSPMDRVGGFPRFPLSHHRAYGPRTTAVSLGVWRGMAGCQVDQSELVEPVMIPATGVTGRVSSLRFRRSVTTLHIRHGHWVCNDYPFTVPAFAVLSLTGHWCRWGGWSPFRGHYPPPQCRLSRTSSACL